MKTLNIKTAPYYKIKITGDQELLDIILEFFMSQRWVIVKSFPKVDENNKDTFYKIMVEESLVSNYDSYHRTITIDKGYFYFLITFIYRLWKSHPGVFEYNTDVDIKGRLLITEKWKSILRLEQLIEFEDLTKYKGSLIQLPCGWGKTELFISIIESYLNQYIDNILVTIPSNSIKDEVNNRLTLYNISSERIKVINPIGYSNSNEFNNNKDLDKWLSKVGLIIHDEVHHVLANSYTKLLNKIPNLEYSYGLSATISQSNLLKYNEFRSWDFDTQSRIGICGVSQVHKLAKDFNKSVVYYRVKGNFGKMIEEDSNNYFKNAITQIKSDIFKECIVKIVKQFGYDLDNRIFYIPVPYIEIGKALKDILQKESIPTIFWTGGYNCDPPEIDSLIKIKDGINSEKYKVLIATSTSNEGVDIGGLTAAILAFGRNEKLIPQVAGRAGRKSTPLIFNIWNEEHGLFNSQARARDYHLIHNYLCDILNINLGS